MGNWCGGGDVATPRGPAEQGWAPSTLGGPQTSSFLIFTPAPSFESSLQSLGFCLHRSPGGDPPGCGDCLRAQVPGRSDSVIDGCSMPQTRGRKKKPRTTNLHTLVGSIKPFSSVFVLRFLEEVVSFLGDPDVSKLLVYWLKIYSSGVRLPSLGFNTRYRSKQHLVCLKAPEVSPSRPA